MKYLVLSDTHGQIDRALEIYKSMEGVDAVVHLGDTEADGAMLSHLLGVEVIGVKGNMDNAYSFDDWRVLENEWGRILLVHGHMHHVKMSLDYLKKLALEHSCKAAFFGHTHVPLWQESEDGFYFLNPGSPSFPRDGSKGSYAVVNTSEEGLEASIIYLK